MTNSEERNALPRLLMVSLGTVYGGAESYYAKLATLLAPDWFLIAVVGNRRLEAELGTLGVEVVCADENLGGLPRYSAALSACRRAVRKFHPRLAHLNGQQESYLAPFLRCMGLPLLTTRHTPFTAQFLREGSRVPVPLKRSILLFSLRRAHRTICVSQLMQDQLAAYLPADRLCFIPTWVENGFFKPHDLPEPGRPLPPRPLRILFVGRVVENKGIFELIEAVRRSGQVELTVVGDGEAMIKARTLASGLPIVFAGASNDCRPAYRAADLLVFPSREGFEGLPQVPLEAMAMGLPCLASDIAAIQELAATGTGGSPPPLALYRHGDLDDLVVQLNALAANPAELLRLGAAGQNHVARHFTADAVRTAYRREFAATLRPSPRST